MSGKSNGLYIWSTTGAAGGDVYKDNIAGKRYFGIPIGSIGYDQDGIAAASVFHWTGEAWTDTGQTVAGFFGV